MRAVNAALRAGYRPPGQPGNGPAALTVAAGKCGVAASGFKNVMDRIRSAHGLEPDWTLYQPPGEPDPPAEVKRRPRVIMPAATPEGRVLRVLAMGDAHDRPDMPKDRFHWMGRLAADSGCEWVVSIGDLCTFDSLNSHIPNESLLGKSKNPFARDAQSLRDALGAFDAGLGGHKPRRHVTLGNHERRVWLYEDLRPEVAGMLTGELAQALEAHGWGWTPYGEYFFLAGIGFIHAAVNRLNKTYGGKNAEMTIANDAVFDHVIGHSHVRREHRAPKLGPSRHVTILNLGCSLPWGHVEEYMYHGATTGWWWGCHVLTLQGGQIVGADAIPMNELERRYG